MAKVSSVEKNKNREKVVKRFVAKRAALKTIITNKNTPIDERMDAVATLAALPRAGCKTRLRNRCVVSGRPRAYYRKFKMSRIALRELGSQGLIPGLTKSSW